MRRYEVIIKIAEYENITMAAKALGYTQANLSHIINKVEDDFQIKLFHRTRHGVKLTRGGKDLIAYMQKIEELEHSMTKVALSHRKSMLRVGSFYSVSAYWMPAIMKRFLNKCPDTVVTIIEKASWSEIEKSVALGEVDCAFYGGPYHSGHDFFPLYKDPYYVVVSDAHPLAGKESTDIPEMSQYPFIMPSEGTESAAIRELVNVLHVKPNILMQTQGDLGTITMIESEFGISVLPGLIAKNTMRKVHAIPFREAITREIGIISRPYGEVAEICKIFISVAKEFAEDWSHLSQEGGNPGGASSYQNS